MSYIMFSTLSLFPYHDWPVFCEIPANTILYLAHPVQRKKKKVAPHDTISPRVRYHVCVGSGPSPSSCIISGGSGRIHLMIFYFIFLLDGRFVLITLWFRVRSDAWAPRRRFALAFGPFPLGVACADPLHGPSYLQHLSLPSCRCTPRENIYRHMQ